MGGAAGALDAADALARRRRIFAGVFALGVLLALAFGAVLAAYDIWGGVPRALWPVARRLFIGAVLFVIAGGVGWVASWPAGERLRASLRAGLLLAGLGALGGGALFLHYLSRWDTSRRICAPALIAPTRAAREAALREGLGPLFPVIDPHSSCLQLERERRELEASGTCPSFVMDDVACRCGSERWTPGGAARCASGPTACQYRSERGGSTLGCAEHGSQYTLEEARRAESGR